MDLRTISTDALEKLIAERDAEYTLAVRAEGVAEEAARVARRAITPLRRARFKLYEPLRAARAEANRRREVLNNVGR